MHHKLKIKDEYFEQVFSGDKTFEIRFNDRGYQKGDTIEFLNELGTTWRDECVEYEITYVTNYEQKPNWVVFSIKPTVHQREEQE